MKEANKYFEVIAFTAGTRNYANSILDKLDPHGELIQHRLYRDSCLEVVQDSQTFYIKDLRILEGRRLEDIVIVDNAVISFAYQIDNGIPILSFREDKEDVEFLQLIKIMEDISQEEDWRNFIKRSFGISDIMSTDTDSFAHLYDLSDDEDESSDEDILAVILQCQRTLSKSSKKIPEEPKKKSRKFVKRKERKFKNLKKVNSFCVQLDGTKKSHTNIKKWESDKDISHEENL